MQIFVYINIRKYSHRIICYLHQVDAPLYNCLHSLFIKQEALQSTYHFNVTYMRASYFTTDEQNNNYDLFIRNKLFIKL